MIAMKRIYLPLTDEEKEYLNTLSKTRTTQSQIVNRAKMLLYIFV